jgi:catechol 2,3-dioxygenase-like lactoylglutathione lyase family enzyme
MIDHLTLTVRDLQSASAFYTRVLAPLGYSKQSDYGVIQGFGPQGKPAFWIKQGPAPQSAMHLAFRSRDRAAVDGFHAAALGAGGKDDGAPGIREHYHPNYYGAFVIDPDGHHIEAVCHAPAGDEKTVLARPPKEIAQTKVKLVRKTAAATKGKAKGKAKKKR